MKNINWSHHAILRRDEIFDYIAKENPEAAINLDISIETMVNRLRDFPFFG